MDAWKLIWTVLFVAAGCSGPQQPTGDSTQTDGAPMADGSAEGDGGLEPEYYAGEEGMCLEPLPDEPEPEPCE